MQYEVELKYRVASGEEIETALEQWGCRPGEPFEQVDRYLAHPCRDFGVTDEAFRLRRTDGSQVVTYKGPRVDTTTKTRRELELPLVSDEESPGSFDQYAALLGAWGFTPVAEVHTRRRKALVDWEQRRVEVSLDEVAQVGRFVELELSAADETEMGSARESLLRLASRLGLVDAERRSYLTLLRAASGADAPGSVGKAT
ncbi:MAG: class IV adenylate cyclase [Pirellulaceae bacterium]